MWGEFDIENLSPIKFREDAFEKLQLAQGTKNLLSALVENVCKGSAEQSDIISGKGGGAIILLAGLPGVGKTLSAEVMAERLQRPLYMVNVGELGETAADMEQALQGILNTAAAWDAILLIDEADIFLEARTEADVSRNAMVAVFLRLLEYYTGILFLTTNRANNLDPAFYSRIHMALHYSPLTEPARQAIWSNLIEMRGIKDIAVDSLAKVELNGRQIKNVLSNAVALAKFERVDVEQKHFNTVIGTIQEFERTTGTSDFDLHGNVVRTAPTAV
jgi:SpoVK/Ycf46/Vps4 family AAA+-type ATPase